MMFKILILQAWYGLSDEALEEQIARDLMFRRFIDLSLSTFWVFYGCFRWVLFYQIGGFWLSYAKVSVNLKKL
jgi:hypothetical protein